MKLDTSANTVVIEYDSEEDVLAAILLLNNTKLYGRPLYLSNMNNDSISDIYKRYVQLAKEIHITPDMFGCCDSLSESDLRKFEVSNNNQQSQYPHKRTNHSNSHFEYEQNNTVDYHYPDNSKYGQRSQQHNAHNTIGYYGQNNNNYDYNNQLQYQEPYRSHGNYGYNKNTDNFYYSRDHVQYQNPYGPNTSDRYRSGGGDSHKRGYDTFVQGQNPYGSNNNDRYQSGRDSHKRGYDTIQKRGTDDEYRSQSRNYGGNNDYKNYPNYDNERHSGKRHRRY